MYIHILTPKCGHRNVGFHANQKKSPPPTNLLDKIIRYAEKDDLLLYATAVFGILMPAVMYFVYKTVHAKYQVYAKRKRTERKRERAKQRAVTLFYMSADTVLKRFTYSLAEQLTTIDPVVVALVPDNLSVFFDYKGIAVFIVPDVDSDKLTDSDNWFFDWLQEIRFEMRERSLFRNLNFCTFTVTKPQQTTIIGKMHEVLKKRLTVLGAREIQPAAFIWNNEDTDLNLQLNEQANMLNETIRETHCDYNSDETDLLSSEDGGSLSELSDDDLLSTDDLSSKKSN
ncbi:Flavodoxin-like domain-containing protein [Aphelenchoides besseyi]|nr:Flavodoxin-like domain-containing protein [Aphelenchoides besseyi]